MSGYGHSGPHASYRSYGPVVQAVSGLSFISGLPGREPSGWGLSYMDNQAAFYNSAAILMAIRHRMLTGEGTEIDVSAVETGISLLGPVMLEVTVNGRVTRGPRYPTGNRLEHPPAAPHGVYPASGEDRWVAIAVFNDEEWSRFADAIGRPAWTADERFASQQSRWENQDALDEAVATWTSQRDRYEATKLLQDAGVRAGAVQNAQDLNETDPQLAHRGVFFEMDHPVIGEARFEGVPVQFDGMSADNWRSGPLLGEDNEYVFKELLGVGRRRVRGAHRIRGDLMTGTDAHAVRRSHGRRAGRRPGRRGAGQAAGDHGRRRDQGRAPGRRAGPPHRPGRGRRPRRRPGRQPALLVLQRRQAQRGARLPDRRRHGAGCAACCSRPTS